MSVRRGKQRSVAPTPTGSVAPYADVRETHSGVVLLMGERAYKFKKPVDLGFLDFSTLERRLDACRREVTLNRRLAPDVYLGIADLVGPTGDVEDHMVVMRRMPDDRRLSTLVGSRADVDAAVRTVAREVAILHATSLIDDAIMKDAGRDALESRWEASFAQLRANSEPVVPAGVLGEIEHLVRRYLAGRGALFVERVESGAVVDGHGDLLADDIFCLADGPRILDCLEFDDSLRHVDGVDDAACLAMDLEHLGDRPLADRFLAWYLEFSGDHAPPSLVDHYVAYRGFVRAKVACLRHAQGDPDAAAQACSLADLTVRHLRRATVTLVLVGGTPGTGKSTLAGGLADRLSLTGLSSDRLRKELAGISPTTPAAAGLREGIYTPSGSERTYGELLRRAGELLAMGESVVLDATWCDARQRTHARDLAGAHAAELIQICCDLPNAEADRRITRRHGVSDVDTRVAAALRKSFDPWPESSSIDTGQAPSTCVDVAAALVRRLLDEATCRAAGEADERRETLDRWIS